MHSLMQDVVLGPSALSSFVPWIVLLATLYLGYKVFYEKDKRWIETLTSSSVLVPAFFLITLSLVPSTVMSLFGIIEPIVTILIQIFSGLLLSMIIIAIPTYMLRKFEII